MILYKPHMKETRRTRLMLLSVQILRLELGSGRTTSRLKEKEQNNEEYCKTASTLVKTSPDTDIVPL